VNQKGDNIQFGDYLGNHHEMLHDTERPQKATNAKFFLLDLGSI
jgi:hypothetical protein